MTQETLTEVRAALTDAWRAAGVMPGEVLMVHSSSIRLLYACKSRNRQFTPIDVVESFLDALGPEGTLLMPLFNFKVINDAVFDIRNTPSAMGAITEAARKHPAALRTEHPFLSFAVLGLHAGEFAALSDYTGIGPNSPFALIHKMNGRIGALDLYDNQCMSFYHHVEQAYDVSYRFIKDVTVDYTNAEGTASLRKFGYYARDWDNNIITDVTRAGEALWDLHLYQGDKPGQGYGFRTIAACDIYDYTADVIASGQMQGTLYTVG